MNLQKSIHGNKKTQSIETNPELLRCKGDDLGKVLVQKELTRKMSDSLETQSKQKGKAHDRIGRCHRATPPQRKGVISVLKNYTEERRICSIKKSSNGPNSPNLFIDILITAIPENPFKRIEKLAKAYKIITSRK